MFYFYYGSNTSEARKRAKAILEGLQTKRPDAEFFRVTGENWNENDFLMYIKGQGLFESKVIVFADNIFISKDVKEWVVKKANELKNSDNAFVFLDGELDTKTISELEIYSAETKKYDLPKKNFWEKEGFNVFSLADALGKKDKKELWSKLAESFMSEKKGEEITGVLFWQVKAIILSKRAESATKAGLSPFVYSKSKKYASNFSDAELENLSRKLISIYHDAHNGMSDMEVSLERFVLGI